MADPRKIFHQLKSDSIKVKGTLGLAMALPRFFRERITLPKAEAEIKRLLDTRAERFVAMVRVQIYERPESPYLRLLKHAGCELSDLEHSISRRGLEDTLAKLAGEGVYLTSDEFKGKNEVVRGLMTFRVAPSDFERRRPSAGFAMQSSGTRNLPVATFSALDWRALQALGEAIFNQAHDLFPRAHAIIEPVLAGRVNPVLRNAKVGIPTDRWFDLKVPAHGALEVSYHRLNARLVAKLGRRFGPGIADPEDLDPGELQPVVEWILDKRGEGRNCCITAVVSNAVRIARKATERGLSLRGTTFAVSGEPLTRSKKLLIDATGADIALRYGPGGDCGTSLGCGNARFMDEMHVPQTVVSFAENPRVVDSDGGPIRPLMLTTMHPASPRLLLNVENGDHATITNRNCGCPLQWVGFTQHLHTVRSFEKMTSEGMNYSGTDLFELLEDTIPAEFGGGPGDYQLVEEEDDSGQTRLTLMVHPRLGDLDSDRLLSRLKQGLACGSRNHRFMSKVWEDAGVYRIERGCPYASARGKTLPLYIKPKI